MTTLRRNGSDYSATILGALLRCANIVIWTDVDGVFSADPRKVLSPTDGKTPLHVNLEGMGRGGGVGCDQRSNIIVLRFAIAW